MATCTACGGFGGREGNYPPCYSCGGTGTGGFANVACGACGGSRRGSTREWIICSGCGGAGTVGGPAYGAQTGPAQNRRGTRRPTPPWTRANTIAAAIAFLVTGIWLLREQLEWPVALILSLVAALFIGRLWRELGLAAAIFAGALVLFQILF